MRAIVETILLLAGDSQRVAANSLQLLGTISPQYPDYQAFRFYAGQISAEELAVGAGASGYRRCGVCYLIATSFLARGDREAARQYFRHSVETRTHWLTQYQWSRAFLARLDQDPHWPPWIRSMGTLPRDPKSPGPTSTAAGHQDQ